MSEDLPHNQLMLRQKWGSVVCPSCRNLVGVNDERCFTCGRWNPGLWGFAPALNRLGRDLGFTPFVMGACGVLYALMLAYDPNGINDGIGLSLFSPSPRALFMFGESGAVPVFAAGRWWTVLTAGWLHAGLLHIVFNMMWIRQLAPATGEMYGPSRMVIIYTIAGIAGFTASTLAGAFIHLGGAGFTVGASAPIFGLLGALVYYGRRTGSSIVGNQAKSWAVMLFIFGFIFPGVDNWAHLGGFAGGYATAKLLDPLSPERLDHLIGALVCLGATGIAIVFSFVDGLRFRL
jgi:rhomboid protease GluP